MRLLFALAVVIAAAALPQALSADEFTYFYVGPNFINACGNCPDTTHISGSFTLNTALPADFSSTTPISVDPVSFSFTDGLTTITPLNLSSNSYVFPGQSLSYGAGFDIYSTNAAGDITDWSVRLLTLSPGKIVSMTTSTENVYCCAPTKQFDGSDYWTVNGQTIRFVTGNWNYAGKPGNWTETVQATATPEPSFFFPVAVAAVATFAAGRFRKNNARRVPSD